MHLKHNFLENILMHSLQVSSKSTTDCESLILSHGTHVFLSVPLNLNISVLELPEGPTNWEDEAAMRARIANYTAEKFSHGYHNWDLIDSDGKNSAATLARRKKRDGGLVSGPIATAVVTGMIGECCWSETGSLTETLRTTPPV